jgi:hypothetical protein
MSAPPATACILYPARVASLVRENRGIIVASLGSAAYKAVLRNRRDTRSDPSG